MAFDGCKSRRLPLAMLLAQLTLARTFSRSGLGPLWSTLGVALAVATVGLLFGTILRSQLLSFESYMANLASGLVMWTFLSAVVGEASIVFARWMPILRHSTISMSVIALSVLLRHLPVLAVNLGLLLVLQYLLLGLAPAALPLLGAVLLLLVHAAWLGLATMVLGARFRDIGQLVGNLMQIAFLLTPILWPPYFLGRFEYLLLFNPFHHLLSVFTAAAAGRTAPALYWELGGGLAVLGCLGASLLYRWSRNRWPYWI